MNDYLNAIKVMVKTEFKGSHNWPEASQFAGPEVKFLETEHRHTFHIKCTLTVSHDDRDVEFFVLQGILNNIIDELYPFSSDQPLLRKLGRRSCETVALELIDQLRTKLSYRNSILMEVWEDNEVGAEITSTPKFRG